MQCKILHFPWRRLLTSSQTTGTKTTGSTQDFRKHWLGYALALSLVLHFGAALVFTIAGGFRIAGENTHNFIIADIALTPSISAPAVPRKRTD